VALSLTGMHGGELLLDLPWHLPLEQWPDEHLDVPAVVAVGVVTGRESAGGEPLVSALLTRHLQFSLPYRALFSQTLRPDTAVRLLDALTVLLVRLHSEGFYWGDCSLSNTLFRRDAGAFAAYLVDAETGELHPQLSEGQRRYDLEIAQQNIVGELLDLRAGGLLDAAVDPFGTGDDVVARYSSLWSELTARRARVAQHRLHARGPGRAEGAARQARAGGGLPRGARAPLVPVGAGGPRRRSRCGGPVLRRRHPAGQARRAGGARRVRHR
jgi:hypothetical protein